MPAENRVLKARGGSGCLDCRDRGVADLVRPINRIVLLVRGFSQLLEALGLVLIKLV